MSLDSSARETGRIGQYRLLQRLGEGGMGVVHLALDESGKAVAIKVLRQHIASDPDARRRLAREVATLRRVRHPRIAAVIDADVECEIPYLVTSFVPGKPLDAHVRDHGPLPRGHVARVGSVLAEALRAIHDLGIVHRDVKPANVMLLDGEPILIDFGIAHVTDESRITHTGLVMGTPGYLSPEIIGGDAVTAATDWWGWGATLAFAATGRPPFGTGPIEVVLDRVRRGQADIEGVDAGLRATLTSALAVDPTRRPSPTRLVAGLAAVAPIRNGARAATPSGPVIDLSANDATERTPPPAPLASEAVTEKTPPPPREAFRRHEAVTSVVPPPGAEAVTSVVPPPGAEAVTSVVPPPTDWGHPVRSVPPAPWDQQNPWDQSPQPAATYPPPPYPPPAPRSSPPPSPWQSAPRPEADQEAAGPPAKPGDAAKGVLLGVVVVLAAVAAVAPFGAVWIAAIGMTAARVIDRSNTALLQRRDQRGRRGSDGLVTAMALPWRLVKAAVTTAFAMILPILIGISVAFISAAIMAGAPSRSIPSQPLPLALGMAALLLTAVLGPGGGSVRRGAAKGAQLVCPGPRARIVVWIVLALALISAFTVISAGNDPDWGPLQSSKIVNMLSTN